MRVKISKMILTTWISVKRLITDSLMSKEAVWVIILSDGTTQESWWMREVANLIRWTFRARSWDMDASFFTTDVSKKHSQKKRKSARLRAFSPRPKIDVKSACRGFLIYRTQCSSHLRKSADGYQRWIEARGKLRPIQTNKNRSHINCWRANRQSERSRSCITA